MIRIAVPRAARTALLLLPLLLPGCSGSSGGSDGGGSNVKLSKSD